ncbi:transcription factor JUNGBRUNNEN 1-like [Zingiber officinale]|uniref:NAC domain-containing protein n=1 Tax=Zingiber officinale TaxID=94328 RepID=A0A8J5IE22_ZINOF|nr:transcription factor JUNGBRUNNEN 1-like [Zingiber officinale]XP_042375576.1 transcription factor JUNGBRUNNEN 1-like [Zingiber officinale]KAG6532444.1 hypothetical protein ZIOFF_006287 [Zingiber officinale]KAG6532446.1 hypothetical protein ZIOFF_006290 [Zingiber officinale]
MEEEEAKKREEVELQVMDQERDVVLPGFRFHPTDEELVGFYLRRKVERKRFSIEIIKEINIYKHDPWELPKFVSTGEQEWYFFCLRGRKYRNSIRPNRVTGSGFWKATGIDRPIYSSSNADDCIGLKKSLVYYKGSAGKGTKTDWMMHEFRHPCKDNANTDVTTQEAEVWTICRIFKRNVSYKRNNWRAIDNIKSISPDSSSKTNCRLESISQNECNYLIPSSYSHGDPRKGSTEENDRQINANQRQWNSSTKTHIVAPQSKVEVNPNVNDYDLKDGNWDELGRIVEFLTNQNVASYCI